MANGLFEDLLGTTQGNLQVSIGGVKLQNNSGNLNVVNTSGVSSNLTANVISSSSSTSPGIVLNSTGTYPTSIAANVSASATWTLTLPTSAGSASQYLQTDGAGNTYWVTGPSASAQVHTAVHTVSYADISPSTSLTLPANATVIDVYVIVDTVFNGSSPSLSVGIIGNTSKYYPTTAVDLTTATSYMYHANLTPDASPESVFISFVFSGASQGSCRVFIDYVNAAAY